MNKTMAYYNWMIYNGRIMIREIDLSNFHQTKSLCFCGSGKAVDDCHSIVQENTAMAYLMETFRIIESTVQSAAPTPTCPKECAECCDYCFEVSALEYFNIITHLQKRKTLLPVSSVRKTEKLARSMRPAFPNYADVHELSGKHIYSHPCIFLDNRRGKCRIYEARPLLCRLYGYYTSYGECLRAKDQLSVIPLEMNERASKFLGTVITPNNEGKKPLAAPLVYWFGGNSPIYDRADARDLFLVATEKDIDKYVRISIHLDFDSWFAI